MAVVRNILAVAIMAVLPLPGLPRLNAKPVLDR
jgi:hypothetical protein